MLACKQQIFLFSGGSNRATPTHMSKISCVVAALNVRGTFVQRGPERSVDKARITCGFANMRGVVLNSYNYATQSERELKWDVNLRKKIKIYIR